MIFLACGDGNEAVYVDISAITGIKNMIEKHPVKEINRLLNASDDIYAQLSKLFGNIRVEEPHSDPLKFEGKIKLNNFPKAIDVNIDNILKKGSILHSSAWALGIVVYAGKETKIEINLKSINKKTSNVENMINEGFVILMVFLQRFIIGFVLVLQVIRYSSDAKGLIENYFLMTVLVCYVFPFSLYVSLSIIRAVQAKEIQKVMKNDICFNTTNINENLGKIEYLVTDKTGTLTENNLQLKTCYVDGK